MSVLERDVCIREMPVLEKCLYWRDVCIRKRDVCIREMSVLKRCLYWRSVCIREREMSVLERHMSVLERCLYCRGIHACTVNVNQMRKVTLTMEYHQLIPSQHNDD